MQTPSLPHRRARDTFISIACCPRDFVTSSLLGLVLEIMVTFWWSLEDHDTPWQPAKLKFPCLREHLCHTCSTDTRTDSARGCTLTTRSATTAQGGVQLQRSFPRPNHTDEQKPHCSLPTGWPAQ